MSAQKAEGPVIVGVDGSRQSIEALRYGARLAEALGRPLEAVTTWEPPPLPAQARFGGAVYPGWSAERDAEDRLWASVREAFDDAPPARLATGTLEGPAASVLVEESRRAELLVLGSRGRGGFAGLLLGSVSAVCAAHAHCPVLIVRPGEGASLPGPA